MASALVSSSAAWRPYGFAGGFKNDTVWALPAAVDGDTLTGGSGSNKLTLTSAGSVNLGGVSKFGTITLAAGNTASLAGSRTTHTIYAGTGLGTYTAGSGSDSSVFIKSSLPSQTLDNFQVGSDDILVYGTHSAGGFDLGSTDNPLNPSTPTAIDPSIFIASASGAFTGSTQRFAYDTSNGQLHYSATGSNSSESLVATLTGAPAFTASNLLFDH